MDDQRLFHRYPSSLRIAFRVGGKSYRGRLTDVSAGGGFIRSDRVVAPGTRIQMAAQLERGQPSIWLDLRVTWTRESAAKKTKSGFGGYWLYASSRHGEDNLREFLSTVLGITKPVVRPMSAPSGGETVFVYRFPDIYDRIDEDFPWDTPQGARHPSDGLGSSDSDESLVRLPAPGESGLGPSKDPPPRPKRAPRVSGSGSGDAPTLPAALTATTTAIMAEVADLPAPDESEIPAPDKPESLEESTTGADGPAAPTGGRWAFLTRKLAGLRGTDAADAKASTPANLDFSGSDFVVKYKSGKRFEDAQVERIGTGWMVFTPGGETPRTWERLEIRIPVAGKKKKPMEIHVTVTRIKGKNSDETPRVHCKVNRVDEKGMTGAYHDYVEAFNAKS